MTNHSSTITINGKTYPVIEWNPMWHPSTYILSERANMQLTNIRDKFLSNRELLAVYEGRESTAAQSGQSITLEMVGTHTSRLSVSISTVGGLVTKSSSFRSLT